MSSLVRRYSQSEETFFRNLIRPEEERDVAAKGNGSFRWFRSSNVIPLEKYRRPTPAEDEQQVA